MAIAITLREYLDQAGVDYDLIPHPYTPNTRSAAEAARVPTDQVAKPVLFEDDHGYVMAVVPASRRVELQTIEKQLGRKLVLASERELRELFTDCSKGAVPAIGQAYGLDVVWDECLATCPDIYFEAGDHTDLVHMTGREFTFLMGRTRHGPISRPEA